VPVAQHNSVRLGLAVRNAVRLRLSVRNARLSVRIAIGISVRTAVVCARPLACPHRASRDWLMSTDYLGAWEGDWQARRDWNPDVTARAWELREQGWSYAEIADAAGVTVAEAYKMVAAQRAYEATPDPIGTIAHLLTTVNFNLSHARRHMKSALDSGAAERQFHLEHADKHLAEAADHADHLTDAVKQQYPVIGKEYDKVIKEMGPATKP
jgi:hypothetical protein